MRSALIALAACGTSKEPPPKAIDPVANLARDITDEQLAFDFATMTATATITFAPATAPGASVEIGDLTFDSVQMDGADLPYAITGQQMDLGVPAYDKPIAIDVAYHWLYTGGFTGPNAAGYTLTWPYFCGNLFPCHSQPADGVTFSLDLENVPAGKMAVFPATLATAPSYQLAWSLDAYTEMPLGTTTNGTQISVFFRPGEDAAAAMGTAHMTAAFDWFEQTLGPYRFGPRYSSVSVGWPRIANGGMEHHPYSHIGYVALADEYVNVHESAHGWFGDGIRIACWEDFVLSEGTVDYLTARALDVVAPSVGAATWQTLQTELGQVSAADPVWPQSCGTVDIIKSHLYGYAPYKRGAFFYKALADRLGADQIDTVLATFFQKHAGGAARMSDMLQTIQDVTGYDPTACAQTWLLGPTVPTPGPCP
jgi:aminopeptidase N